MSFHAFLLKTAGQKLKQNGVEKNEGLLSVLSPGLGQEPHLFRVYVNITFILPLLIFRPKCFAVCGYL